MDSTIKVAALQKAIQIERLEDIRQAQRFRELSARVRAFREEEGVPLTDAEFQEWARHTATKAAAEAERLDELSLPIRKMQVFACSLEFCDSADLAAAGAFAAAHSPQYEWMETFAYALQALDMEVSRDGSDFPRLMDQAALLWPQQGRRDPIEVAQEVFGKSGRGWWWLQCLSWLATFQRTEHTL